MKYSILALLLIILLLSCSKKDSTPIGSQEDPRSSGNYNFNNVIGTYWVYDWVVIDSNQVETPLSITDTITIIGDTIINGLTYSIYNGDYFGGATTRFLRDSSGYIVTSTGQIIASFEHQAQKQTNSGTLMNQYGYYTLLPLLKTIKTVPAGAYDCSLLVTHWYMLDSTAFNVCGDPEYTETIYTDPFVGEVASQRGYMSQIVNQCTYNERRLVEYYVP